MPAVPKDPQQSRICPTCHHKSRAKNRSTTSIKTDAGMLINAGDVRTISQAKAREEAEKKARKEQRKLRIAEREQEEEQKRLKRAQRKQEKERKQKRRKRRSVRKNC